mgnify:CR=1 FL=1
MTYYVIYNRKKDSKQVRNGPYEHLDQARKSAISSLVRGTPAYSWVKISVDSRWLGRGETGYVSNISGIYYWEFNGYKWMIDRKTGKVFKDTKKKV